MEIHSLSSRPLPLTSEAFLLTSLSVMDTFELDNKSECNRLTILYEHGAEMSA